MYELIITKSHKGLLFRLAPKSQHPRISQYQTKAWTDVAGGGDNMGHQEYPFTPDKRYRFYAGLSITARWSYVGRK